MNTSIHKPQLQKRVFIKSLALLLLLVLVVAPIIVLAITYAPPITINNPTPAEYDFFGTSVAIDGNKFIVGTPFDDAGAYDAGSAYLYDVTTGTLLQTFNSPSPVKEGHFGHSVSISGDRVLIGGGGSAYLFDATTGALLQTFNSSFGTFVSISGDKVLIGAYAAPNPTDPSTTGAGSAYLFDATTGALLQTFNNPSPAVRDYFGYSVSISGDKVLIGTPSEDGNWADDVGSVYLYDATTGTLLHNFKNPTYRESDYSGSSAYDQFGHSVSISGDKVLIGAPYDDTGTWNAGSAYLFDATTGTLLHSFNNPTPATDDYFGFSVSISGDKVLIGAHGDDTGAINAGSAYLYDAATGALLQTFNNPTPAQHDSFGFPVSISGDKIVIGASSNNTGAGSAYLYLPLPDTDGDGIADNADNCPADANADQTDTDGDGQGNPCDFTPNGDTDGDGVDNLADNCPGVANAGQEDNDSDGIGNVCDPTPNGEANPNPMSIDQCKQLGWMDFGFRNQGQCVAFVNTGHDSR